ncbi:DHA2 family efflux MFS transporter permease subunit [Sporolactobacillus shoreicorticis]|uniref:MFS transporter n=1 Tax=Sporolactobacillus shoreicorticis TaxID=1923877 RepID=A0ABW5S550_9BACL|nr:DHA2 family efflux MFS transporter permease subunit [Sporolactobacillus shoreicorticis]MCO7124365.1 DHA2 family efflux MFS transporter permease subunit [Sporolactobacillus shoreicorticis]
MNDTMRKSLGFIAATLAFVMAILDTTIVNIVLPDMMKDLNTSVSNSSWILNAYNMAFAVLLLSAARFADQFGRRRVFLLGIMVFTVSSLLCGIASNIHWLISFRIVQGMGAAILVPVSIPILLSLFDKARQPIVIAVWGACSALASACGPVLGGLLTNYGSWHDVFFVNIPLGALAFVLTAWFVPESFDSSASRRIDWTGMLFLSGAVASLTFYLIKGNDYGWTNPGMLILLLAFALALLIFLGVEWKTQTPMLPIYLFRNRIFQSSSYVILLIGILINAIMFLCSLYLTRLRGLSVLHAGYVLGAFSIGSMLMSLICSRFIKKIPPAILLAAASCMIGLSTWLMSQFNAGTAYRDIVFVLILSGCGFGINLPVIMNLIVSAVPGSSIGMASGIGNMARTLGSIVGVALIVAVLTGSLQGSLHQVKYEALKRISRDTILLPSVQNTVRIKIKAIKTNTFTGGALSSNRKKINQSFALLRTKELDKVNKKIDRQAEVKWVKIAEAFKLQQQQLQRRPNSQERTLLLAQLDKERQRAAEKMAQQKKSAKKQALRSVNKLLDQQQNELFRLTDWLQTRTKKAVAHVFAVAFRTITGIAFIVLLFCPFLTRKQHD